jgi:hypothetical protein
MRTEKQIAASRLNGRKPSILIRPAGGDGFERGWTPTAAGQTDRARPVFGEAANVENKRLDWVLGVSVNRPPPRRSPEITAENGPVFPERRDMEIDRPGGLSYFGVGLSERYWS